MPIARPDTFEAWAAEKAHGRGNAVRERERERAVARESPIPPPEEWQVPVRVHDAPAGLVPVDEDIPANEEELERRWPKHRLPPWEIQAWNEVLAAAPDPAQQADPRPRTPWGDPLPWRKD